MVAENIEKIIQGIAFFATPTYTEYKIIFFSVAVLFAPIKLRWQIATANVHYTYTVSW